MPFLIGAALLVFLAIAVAMDVRERRIPNIVSGPAMLVGVGLHALHGGSLGLLTSLGGLAAAVAVLFVPFALGGIGAGDVKMMGAVGALLGPRLALASVVVGMILGGAVMALHLARRGRLREKLVATWTMIATAALVRSVEPLRVSPAAPGAVALPYSVPLALGTLAVAVGSGALGVLP